MKKLLAAAALSVALSGVAFAEEAASGAAAGPTAAASQCPAASVPADPNLPDGATARQQAMVAGTTAYNSWLNAIRPGFECRRAEYLQAVANLRAREADLTPWNAKVGEINEKWQTEVAEFNGRASSGHN